LLIDKAVSRQDCDDAEAAVGQALAEICLKTSSWISCVA